MTTFINMGPTGAAVCVSKHSVLAYKQGVPGDPVGVHDATLQDDAHAVETWLLLFLHQTSVLVSVQLGNSNRVCSRWCTSARGHTQPAQINGCSEPQCVGLSVHPVLIDRVTVLHPSIRGRRDGAQPQQGWQWKPTEQTDSRG